MKIKLVSKLFIYSIISFPAVFDLFAQTIDTSTAAIQVIGQNTVINQQLISENIISVVSPVKIWELPDASILESIGRLPGIMLLRTGGQARQLVIRGFSPEYNQITVAGVPVPANESYRASLEGGEEFGGGRGVDLRIIPSGSLKNITVYKTYTPDMDANFLGGKVDFAIRKARKSLPDQPFGLSYLPATSLQAQGGYTNITNEYNNYKFNLTLEKRFLDERFGIFVQGSIQQQHLTWDRLDAAYVQMDAGNAQNSLALTNLDLYFFPGTEKRYNSTITLDYDIADGNLAFMNIISQNETDNDYWRQNYGLQRAGDRINYYGSHSSNTLNLISNIINYNQKTSFADIDATLSHSYSENIFPNTWTTGFTQLSAGTGNILETLPPVKIAERAQQLVNFDELLLRTVTANDSHTKQKELHGSVDFSRDLKFKDLFSVRLKAGGMYEYSNRSHDYNYGSGWIFFGEIGARILEAFPWLADYGIDPVTGPSLFLTPFNDSDINTGTFLADNYTFNNKLNMEYMETVKDIAEDYGKNISSQIVDGPVALVPSMFKNVAYDYSGEEQRSAGYIMGTFNIGSTISIMGGVRYQNLTTSYRANRFYNASWSNTYPYPFPGRIDTTFTESHGYWLPAIHLKYQPLTWLRMHAAYSTTLAYPNFRAIIPVIDVYVDRVEWNDVDLEPARSENYDLQFSMYENTLGLFTIGGFLKRVNDFVLFNSGYITDPQDYKDLHDVAQYPNLDIMENVIETFSNNSATVKVWGIESDWQTRFHYLPDPLNGLLLNVNYTYSFSEVKYPKAIVAPNLFPPRFAVIDSSYTDHLVNQPENILNVSLGYEYKDFSILLSMIYQSSVFNKTDFYKALRSYKAGYHRWDLAAGQKLPWYNIEMFLNVNNLTGENDTYLMRGNGFPARQESYGLTAALGFRVNFD